MIGIEGKWKTEDPDGRKCRICLDPIFSPMHVYYLVFLKDATPIMALCNHCFYLPNDGEEEE